MKEIVNTEGRQQALDDLFKDLPSDTKTLLDLPSEGRFYESKGPYILRPMEWEDELILQNSIRKGENSINLILSRCLSNININELLLLDQAYVLFKLREISYGSDYMADIQCPSCGKEHKQCKINLSEMIINKIPVDIQDIREITLPVLKKTVKVRFPRVTHEAYFDTPELILNNLWRLVPEFAGNTDPAFITLAIKRLKLKDQKFLLNEIKRPDLGLDPRFLFVCDRCNHEEEIVIPANSNFFSIS